jgi:hypothetical protein
MTPYQKITVPSANLTQRWNHTANLIMVWTLCLYGFSAWHGWLMELCCDNITPCQTGAEKVAMEGYFHILQGPFGTAAAKDYCQHAPFWSGIAAGAALVPNWLLPSRWQQE